MKLRYTVETKHSAAFTAYKKVSGKQQADGLFIQLGLMNVHAGYKKHSDVILYDDDDKVLHRYDNSLL